MKNAYTEFPVSGPLSRFIECIWVTTQSEKIVHRIIPDQTVELIFTEEKLVRWKADSEHKIVLQSHLAGLKTKPHFVAIPKGKIIGIRFRPEGIYHFITPDVSEIIDQSIPPEEVFGNGIFALEQIVLESARTNNHVQIQQEITSYFERELRLIREDLLLNQVLLNIYQHGGNVCISQLAKQTSYSLKTIERRFRQKMGITPKVFAQLYRFHQSILAMSDPEVKLSDIAYDQGYFDQMHFIKDVKRFAELTPKQIYQHKTGLQKPTLNP